MSNGVPGLMPHNFRLQGVQKTVDRYKLRHSKYNSRNFSKLTRMEYKNSKFSQLAQRCGDFSQLILLEIKLSKLLQFNKPGGYFLQSIVPELESLKLSQLEQRVRHFR